MKWVRSDPSLSNKDLWCGDVTSWQAEQSLWCGVAAGGRGGGGWYPTGRDVGRKRKREEKGAVNEHRSRGGCCGRSQCGCLVYQTHFLLRLPKRWDVIALQAPDRNVRSKRKKNNTEIWRECLGRDGNSVTMKMSVRSLLLAWRNSQSCKHTCSLKQSHHCPRKENWGLTGRQLRVREITRKWKQVGTTVVNSSVDSSESRIQK